MDLLGKRKKAVKRCPNPLFEGWLTEWRDDAADKGLKTQYTYAKALRSLKKYPICLASGKECKFLENFGDKICKMLDDKLAKHREENGYEDLDILPDLDPVYPKKQRLHTSASTASHGSIDIDDIRIPDPDPVPGNNNSQKSSQKRKTSASQKAKAGPREYVPKYKSGPYALILTLYRDKESPTSRGFMGKRELMEQAQPLSEKSFTIPDPGCRYTAWSSMGSLIKKGYIIKEGNPGRYYLTDNGCEIASRILQAEAENPINTEDFTGIHIREEFGNVSAPKPVKATTGPHQRKKNVVHELSDSDSDGEANNNTKNTHQSSHFDRHSPIYSMTDTFDNGLHTSFDAVLQNYDSGFLFLYINEDGKEVKKKDEAEVLIDEEISVGFLIKCKYEDLLMCAKRYKLCSTRQAETGHVYAYLANEDSPENSTQDIITQKSKPKPSTNEKRKPIPAAKSSHSDEIIPRNSTETMKKTRRPVTSATITRPPAASATITRPVNDEPSSQDSIRSISSVSSCVSEFVLQQGAFDVILCVDNAEVYGQSSSSKSKETLMSELRKNGIQLEVRKLQIGDFLWIAKERHGSKELVLDYIIERKRMDDLAGSIVDGRFKEQKFRLKNSGLKNPIYLVEDYGSTQHFSIPEDTLLQAVINTQVIDSFYVKRVKSIKESAAYLTIMTRYLQSLYRNKTLYGCSKDNIADVDKSVTDREVQLMTFEEFSSTTMKTKKLTIKEMFGKQLCQLFGLTPEKACAILEVYPTPASLFRAYSQIHSVAEKEKLLSDIKFGPLQKKIGVAMSKQMYMAYNMEDGR